MKKPQGVDPLEYGALPRVLARTRKIIVPVLITVAIAVLFLVLLVQCTGK